MAGLGGIGTDSITGKTNLVVLGDTSRDRNKKGEDKWSTSGRCKQIEKQQRQHDARQRKVPFEVVSFKAFVKEHGLEEVVERELVTAHFETEKKMEKTWKAPEARIASQVTTTHSSRTLRGRSGLLALDTRTASRWVRRGR